MISTIQADEGTMMDFAAAMPLAGTLGVTIHEGSKERVAGKLPVRAEICTAGGIVQVHPVAPEALEHDKMVEIPV